MFKQLDADSSGDLSEQEFQEIPVTGKTHQNPVVVSNPGMIPRLPACRCQDIFSEYFVCVRNPALLRLYCWEMADVVLRQVQPISMTDGMSISNGKSVSKLDVGMVVEALEMSDPQSCRFHFSSFGGLLCDGIRSRPQFDETQKLTRLRCRVVEDSAKEGWVTMKGNQGPCCAGDFGLLALAHYMLNILNVICYMLYTTIFSIIYDVLWQ